MNQTSVEQPTEKGQMPSVGGGDWFAIRGEWLHVAERRIKLSAVISYRTSAGDVEMSYGPRPQDTVTLYGPHSAGIEWGGPAKALVAALDDFFANAEMSDAPKKEK